jgi:uncharacterized protein
VKTQPRLLLRDALARTFVRAAADAEPAALAQVEALASWREHPAPDPRLAALANEHGEPLFGADGALVPGYEELTGYARDRALRFQAALGWLRQDGTLGDVLAAAQAAWEAGLFFEVHELLEPVWLRAEGARRTALQGLIMAGAALHHLCDDNRAGARALLREAERKLAGSAGALAMDWDLPRFGRELAALADRIDAGTLRSAADVTELPRLSPSDAPA